MNNYCRDQGNISAYEENISIHIYNSICSEQSIDYKYFYEVQISSYKYPSNKNPCYYFVIGYLDPANCLIIKVICDRFD